MDKKLTTHEALVAAAVAAIRNWANRPKRDQPITDIDIGDVRWALSLPEIKLALSSEVGRVGDLKWIHMADHETITDHLREKIASLESRLAATEKRAGVEIGDLRSALNAVSARRNELEQELKILKAK